MRKFNHKVLLILAAVAGFSSSTMLPAAEREQVVVSNLGPQIGEQVPDSSFPGPYCGRSGADESSAIYAPFDKESTCQGFSVLR